ncbi:MAG: SIMPL domain-containing protein [Patescibacteria group bacterium]
MNERIKNYLGGAIIVVLFIFAYAAFVYVDSYSKSIEPSSFRSFSASAEGKVTAIPDVASFSFSVITQGGKDIAKIQKENTGKVNKIIELVKSESVENKDIKTQSYNLEPRYQYFNCYQPLSGSGSESKPCPPPEIVGYTITQAVSVKIRNFEKIGGILSGVVEKGANSVSQLSFVIDKPDKIKEQAREEAIKKAKENAKSIARAGGFNVGKLLSIEEGGDYQMPIYRTMGMASVSDEKGLPSPTIEPGSQEITVNIILRYEID